MWIGQNGGMSQVAYTESSFTDSHGIEIFTYQWIPESFHAVVQVAHGLGEHAKRYDAFARHLASAGFAVYADDHRGHGETGRTQWGGDLSRMGRLGPGGLRAAEAAILELSASIRRTHPGLPLVFLGHSWGSLMGQRIINREPHPFDAVILSGSAYRMPGSMESGDLNRHHRTFGTTGYEWLSRDPAVAEAFAADELCFTADVLKLFGLADALRLYGVPSRHVDDVPMLVFGGSDDSLSRGDSLERLAAAYRNRGVQDLTFRVYPGGRHETLNETNRLDVFRDVTAWVLEKFPSAPVPAKES